MLLNTRNFFIKSLILIIILLCIILPTIYCIYTVVPINEAQDLLTNSLNSQQNISNKVNQATQSDNKDFGSKTGLSPDQIELDQIEREHIKFVTTVFIILPVFWRLCYHLYYYISDS